jgi:serine/threonine-protein kinase
MGELARYPVGYVAGGRYEIVKTIRSGAMGSVHEALDRLIKKRVAVKFLSAELVGDAQIARRFHLEAQAAGQIRHDNVCDVSDLGVTEDGVPYLVMELLAGETLEDRLTRCGKLPPKATVEIALQVLSALGAAHDRGIVHRDLKPGNVVLAHGSDGREKVKLIDFGIAKFLDNTGSSTVTASGIAVGTPYYMSPEQVRGETGKIDHRTDIWAMGVILYESLTGKLPFDGKSYQEIFAQIFYEEPARPREHEPDLPPALELVVLKALSKDRDERYSSASDMAGALIDAMEGKLAASIGLGDTERDDRAPDSPASSDIALAETQPWKPGPSTPPPAEPPAGPSIEASLSFTDLAFVGLRNRWAMPALVVTACIILGGGIAAVLASVMRSDAQAPVPAATGPSDVATPEPAAPPFEAAASPVTEDQGDAATKAPQVVDVALDGIPPGAVVRFDGVEVRDGVLRGPEGSSGLLEVEAEGFHTVREPVVLEQGQRIDLGRVLVRRSRSSERRDDSRPHDTPAPHPANAPRIVGGWGDG